MLYWLCRTGNSEAVEHLTKVWLCWLPLAGLCCPPFDLLCLFQPSAAFPSHWLNNPVYSLPSKQSSACTEAWLWHYRACHQLFCPLLSSHRDLFFFFCNLITFTDCFSGLNCPHPSVHVAVQEWAIQTHADSLSKLYLHIPFYTLLQCINPIRNWLGMFFWEARHGTVRSLQTTAWCSFPFFCKKINK